VPVSPTKPPLLLHVFPTFVAGGAQVRTVRLMAALAGEFRHAVLALDGATDAAELVPPEVDLELLPAPAKAGSATTIRRLAKLFSALRPSALCTYNWGAIDAVVAARLSGSSSVVHHEDGFGPDEAHGFKRRRVWTRRLVLRGASAVVVPSFTLARIATGIWKLPPALLQHIANGIRVDDFVAADGNAALRSELGFPSGAFVVGYVGHLRAEKNPVRFVDAFARLAGERDFRALVLGDGPERGAVEARALELGVAERVHLAGHRSDLAGYYRAMDAFCIPSNTEQMPVALLEAMAARLPVVSTDVGDVARILPGAQSPFVVAPEGDVAQALANGLERLASDQELSTSLGAENQSHVARTYGFETMVDAYRGVYGRALSG